MRAVIVAHGAVVEEDRAHLAGADLVVAADGGAVALERWGVLPHVAVGDFDSLGADAVAALQARGVRIERHPREKDETDLELALDTARRAGATAIDVLGALGGDRADLAVANALLLAAAGWRDLALRAVHGGTTVRPLHAGVRLELAGSAGGQVSLVPIGEVRGVVTRGLRYPLRGEALASDRGRGLSNEIVATPASVICAVGRLLVFERRGS